MLKKKKNNPTTLGNFFLLPKSKDVAHARQFLPLNNLFSKNKQTKNFCLRNVKKFSELHPSCKET